MKNKSWKYPFTTLDDKFFDKNNDGELDMLETIFRDGYLDNMNRLVEEDIKEKQNKSNGILNQPLNYKNTNHNIPQATGPLSGSESAAVLFAIIVLIGSIVIAVAVDFSGIGKALMLFAAVGIALYALKAVGIYE